MIGENWVPVMAIPTCFAVIHSAVGAEIACMRVFLEDPAGVTELARLSVSHIDCSEHFFYLLHFEVVPEPLDAGGGEGGEFPACRAWDLTGVGSPLLLVRL